MLKLIQLFFSFVRPLTLLKWAIYMIVPAMLWVWANFPKIQDYLQASQRREAYEQEVAQLKTLQERLERERTDLQTGGFQLEKAIREKQFMVYPGEKIIFIQPPEKEPVDPAPAADAE